MYRGTKIRMTDFLYETFRETVKSTSFTYWKKTVNLDFYTQRKYLLKMKVKLKLLGTQN